MIMALAGIEGFKFLIKKLNLRKYALAISFVILIFSAIVARQITFSPIALVTNKVFWQEFRPREDIFNSLRNVPKEGSLASQNNLLSHLLMRNENVMLIDKGYRMKNPEIIVFDLSSGQNPNNFFPLDYNFFFKEKSLLEKNKTYRRIPTDNENIYIYVLR